MKSHPHKTSHIEGFPQTPWSVFPLILSILLFWAASYSGFSLEGSGLAFLISGILLGILSPWPANGIGGLGVLSIWIVIVQARDGLAITNPENILATFAIASAVFFAIMFRKDWQFRQAAFQKLQDAHQLLTGKKTKTGLASSEIAEFRLLEELERAQEFEAAVGVLLFSYFFRQKKTRYSLVYRDRIQQAIARYLKGVARVFDLPFQIEDHTFGIILLARNREILTRRLHKISRLVNQSRFITVSGQSHNILALVELKCSWVIQDHSSLIPGPTEAAALLKAAQNKLQEEKEIWTGDWRDLPTQPSMPKITVPVGVNGVSKGS